MTKKLSHNNIIENKPMSIFNTNFLKKINNNNLKIKNKKMPSILANVILKIRKKLRLC